MAEQGITEHTVRLEAEPGVWLDGTLSVPDAPSGVVLFAHGSGSSRFSPRNRYVAGVFQQAGLATLLMDLLTQDEEAAERWTRHLRFDIELLARRLQGATRWLARVPGLGGRPLGLIGSSTGAGAALVAAGRAPDAIQAVVSRGGRPDLAGTVLPAVRAPTLLIVGGDDTEVIELNRQALEAMRAPRLLEIVPGATHLFEEAGTLEQAARLARDWFLQHLAPAARERPSGEAPP
ncbi:dienelactone hydrolase family protein [Corallococcus sp. EGB]|uniref:dienelactone hydrolase family protein n=1 Tax=Corallococcus sp. EGB TaxID=1521117 RepID=UPI001CC1148D|nr:dienelactone hydrolase family protein [Corallococcus sp. EGB]